VPTTAQAKRNSTIPVTENAEDIQLWALTADEPPVYEAGFVVPFTIRGTEFQQAQHDADWCFRAALDQDHDDCRTRTHPPQLTLPITGLRRRRNPSAPACESAYRFVFHRQDLSLVDRVTGETANQYPNSYGL
jgi:hypothetical protein